MATVNFTNPRARFFDENGEPLAGGRVIFYEAGTSTLKTVYSDAAGQQLAPNPNILDAEGFVEDETGVHLGIGTYDIEVQRLVGIPSGDIRDPNNPAWSEYWTYPDVEGAPSGSLGSLITVGYVNNIEELTMLENGEYALVFVAGYYENGDGGARWMKWDATGNETPNGGTIISPQNGPAFGRWDWLPQTNEPVITPQLFGAFPSDGSLVVASQIDAMISWCLSSQYKHIHFNITGDYWINSASTFSDDLVVEIDAGIQFRADAGTNQITFTCADLIIHGLSPITNPAPISGTTILEVRTKKPIDVYPQWWSVDDTGTFTSEFALDIMTQNLDPQHEIVFDGTFDCQSTVDFSANPVRFKNKATFNIGVAEITFGTFKSESDEPVIIGDLSDLRFTEKTCKSNWLGWYEKTSPYHVSNTFVDFIQKNASTSDPFNFIVDEENAIIVLDEAIAEFQTGNGDHRYFNWTFEKPCFFSLSSSGYIEWGYVSAPDFQIFSPTLQSDYNMIFLNDISVTWWGGVSNGGNEVANQNAIRAAYTQCVQSNFGNNQSNSQRISVDFHGGSFKTNPLIAGDIGSRTRNAIFKNGCIWSDNDTASYLLDLRYGLEAKNFEFISQGDTTNLFLFDTNDIKFERCKLESELGIIDSTSSGKLYMNDCDVDVENTGGLNLTAISHPGRNSVIIHSSFVRGTGGATGIASIQLSENRSYVDHNYMAGFVCNIEGSGSVKDNFIVKGSIKSLNPASTIITGNKIFPTDEYDSKIEFNTDVNGFTVEGLVCKNNTFDDGQISDVDTRTDYQGIAIASGAPFADYGHAADISENYASKKYLELGCTAARLTGYLNIDNGATGTLLIGMDTPIPTFYQPLYFIFPKFENRFTDLSCGFDNNVAPLGGLAHLTFAGEIDTNKLCTFRINYSSSSGGVTNAIDLQPYIYAEVSNVGNFWDSAPLVP